MKKESNVGKTGMFLNPLYPSIHRKACVIKHDYGKSELHRYGIRIIGEANSIAARECEVVF